VKYCAHHIITLHGGYRSRPPKDSLSEEYNHNATYIMRKILELHYNSAVPDAMEICSVLIKYILIRPKSVQLFLKSVNCFSRDNMRTNINLCYARRNLM